MKVYLEKGIGVKASLFLYPHKIEYHSKTYNPLPEIIRAPFDTHIVRILGEDHALIDIEGSLPELKELVKSMSDILDNVKE